MKAILFSILTLASTSLFAWGSTGHRVVGEIAMKYLGPKAKKQVAQLLEGKDLAMVSNYADFVKSDKAFSSYDSWHYLNAPEGKNYLQSEKNKKGDVVQGIIYFEDILRNNASKSEDKQFALKFITHLVADAHQPLHAGYPQDRGGNDVNLNWFGQEKNLHWLWDEGMIDMQQLSYTEYVKFINFTNKKEIATLHDSSYLDWVNESRSYLKEANTALSSGKYWEYKYSYQFIGVVNSRLLSAGIRLAGLLNDIFDRRPMTKKMIEARHQIKESMK